MAPTEANVNSQPPKGPRRYDLQKLEPGDFETLTFLLAHAENRDVIQVRNKDEGLDARLPDPLGRLTLRGWQAKRYPPTKIQWKKCAESLNDAVAFWRPLRVTFVFTHELSADDQAKFRAKLADAHPYVRLDWWGDTEVQRLLRDTEEGRRAAAWLFEGAPTIEDLMAALVSKEPARTPVEIAERQLDPLLDHLRERIRHLRPATLPGPEHLKAMTVNLALPRVVGRAVHPERPARRRDIRPRCLREQLLAVAEQHVILSHQAQLLSSLAGEGGSLSRGTDGFPGRRTRPTLKDLSSPQPSGTLGDSPV